MTRECCFILPNGRKCRCAATRNQAVCRHHAPKPAVPAPPPLPKSERYSDLIRWRRLGSNLQWMPASEIPPTVYDILDSLIDRGNESTGKISDLTAGRFLRALLNRLGRVPFTHPDCAPDQASDPPSSSAAPSAPAPGPAGLAALLAALAQAGEPPAHFCAPLNQTRSRVNQ